jgi:hypothetical protein
MIKNRQDYYSAKYILLEMVKQLKYKYLDAKKIENGKPLMIRYYLGYSLEMLNESLSKLGALKNTTINLYFDLGYWKDEKGVTPMFNFEKDKREIDKKSFNEISEKYLKGFDFAIDIDSDDNIKTAWESAKKVKSFLDSKKLPYSIKFSGGRGFHFLIEDKWFNQRMKGKNKVVLFGRIAHIIMSICKLKSHDKGGTFDDSIYDDRRIFKLAYSLVNKEGKEYVCLPLDDYQFENFKIENMELLNVMNNVFIKERGLLERNHGLSEKQLKNNVTKFVGKMR